MGPRFKGVKLNPQNWTSLSNLGHFQTCGKVRLSSVWWPSKVAFEKKKERGWENITA